MLKLRKEKEKLYGFSHGVEKEVESLMKIRTFESFPIFHNPIQVLVPCVSFYKFRLKSVVVTQDGGELGDGIKLKMLF